MSITNTTKGDPLAMLFDAMVHGSDGAILRQEASGQRELVNSDVLPADIRNRDDFARLGFKFGAPVDGETRDRPATLTAAEMAAELREAGWSEGSGWRSPRDTLFAWHRYTADAYAAMRAAKGAK